MNKLTLPNGATGFYNDRNEWVCTGSQMGRRNVLPDDPQIPCKLRLVRLKWVDGDYDQWGAYWGQNGCNHVYIATNRACVDGAYYANGEGQLVEYFTRAQNRAQAKAQVRAILPHARFYR